MADLLFILITIVFFIASWGLTALCQGLMEG